VLLMAGVDQRLLDLMACPACHGAVHQDGERIVCDDCGRRYPVRDGIPIMLVEEAEERPQEPPQTALPGQQSPQP
jgi:uncharacterized protein